MEQKAVDAQRSKVATFAQELTKDHSLDELREVWCRLPDVAGKPPAGHGALAARIALKLLDLGDEAPKDLKKFIADVKPVREYELKSKDEEEPKPTDEGESSMRTHANKTSARGTLPAGARAKAALKRTPKPSKKADGPREGTITAMILSLSKRGLGKETIGHQVAKEFPGTKFAKEVKAEEFRLVRWYQRDAEKRGWLKKK